MIDEGCIALILRRKFFAACDKMGAPRARVQYHTSPAHDGSPHVETRPDGYDYVVIERGSEHTRRTTRDPDELVYWLVADVVCDLASRFEVANRKPDEDFRRQLFCTELELRSRIDESWAARRKAEIDRILREHP